MSAGIYNLTIEQGATFLRTITIASDSVAIDLTNYTARAMVRQTYGATSALVSLTCTISAPLTGTVVLSLTATQTAALTPTGCKNSDYQNYVWDLELEHTDGTVLRILQGLAFVNPEATK